MFNQSILYIQSLYLKNTEYSVHSVHSVDSVYSSVQRIILYSRIIGKQFANRFVPNLFADILVLNRFLFLFATPFVNILIYQILFLLPNSLHIIQEYLILHWIYIYINCDNISLWFICQVTFLNGKIYKLRKRNHKKKARIQRNRHSWRLLILALMLWNPALFDTFLHFRTFFTYLFGFWHCL